VFPILSMPPMPPMPTTTRSDNGTAVYVLVLQQKCRRQHVLMPTICVVMARCRDMDVSIIADDEVCCAAALAVDRAVRTCPDGRCGGQLLLSGNDPPRSWRTTTTRTGPSDSFIFAPPCIETTTCGFVMDPVSAHQRIAAGQSMWLVCSGTCGRVRRRRCQ
jgi:hypothetical protein